MTPEQAYFICLNKNKRIKELEPFILQSTDYSSIYAKDIIKDTWPEAEPFILKDSLAASYYAVNVMKKRWVEAEPIISKNKWHWDYYSMFFKSCTVNWKSGL